MNNVGLGAPSGNGLVIVVQLARLEGLHEPGFHDPLQDMVAILLHETITDQDERHEQCERDDQAAHHNRIVESLQPPERGVV